MMKKFILIMLITILSTALNAFPCTKYIFDFGGKAMPGKLKISWTINTGFNNCHFEKEEILKHKFKIRIDDLSDKIILNDTTDFNYYIINTSLTNDQPLIVHIQELGISGFQGTPLIIIPQQETLPQLQTKVDTLNFYLLNGYFLNALPLIDDIKKPELVETIKTEYNILFPQHYPFEKTYFNSYLDNNSMSLIKIPTVEGLQVFVKTVNDITKNEPKRPKGFKVYARITPDGKLDEYEVVPHTDKHLFDKQVHLLTFINDLKKWNNVVIIVGRSKNEKKFTLVNERALTDQSSPIFKKKFPYKGGIM